MKGMLRLTILETAIAIILLRVICTPLQAAAQVATDPIASLLLADSSPPFGASSRIDSSDIQFTPGKGDPPIIVGTIGRRGRCGSKDHKPGLRALVPERAVLDASGKPILDSLGEPVKVTWGQTLSEHPTLWFDVPYSSEDDLPADPVEFVLQDRARNDLYRTKVILPKMPGIIGIQVKEPKSSLQLQQWYKWTLQVQCKDAKDNAKNDVVQGLIQRTTINDLTLMQQIKEAQTRKETRKEAALYAEAGIWFDALTILGDAFNAKPPNNSLRKNWETLLKSAGLQETTSRPIVKQ